MTQDERIAALNDLVDALRAQVAEMRAALLSEVEEHGLLACGFTRHEAMILGFVLKKGRASEQAIFQFLYGGRPDGGPLSNIISVHMCRIRKKLPPEVQIEKVRGVGYAISPQSREALGRHAAARMEAVAA